MSINEILADIQTNLIAPKDKFNTFGGYNYRSCESILEALKPLLKKHSCTIRLDDDMTEVGGRVYVKATAVLTNKDGESISASAFAREAINRKGMDDSQLTGATSSYARKYALSGLFAIDDNADHDALNNNKDYTQQQPVQPSPIDYQSLNKLTQKYELLPQDKKSSFMDWLKSDFKVTDLAQINTQQYHAVIKGVDNVLKSLGVPV